MRAGFLLRPISKHRIGGRALPAHVRFVDVQFALFLTGRARRSSGTASLIFSSQFALARFALIEPLNLFPDRTCASILSTSEVPKLFLGEDCVTQKRKKNTSWGPGGSSAAQSDANARSNTDDISNFFMSEHPRTGKSCSRAFFRMFCQEPRKRWFKTSKRTKGRKGLAFGFSQRFIEKKSRD